MSSIDTVARALAADVAALSVRSRLVDTLSRSIARVGGRLPPVSAAPPTLGAPVGDDSGAIAGSIAWPVTQEVNGVWLPTSGVYSFLRGPWGVRGQGYPQFLFTIAHTVSADPTGQQPAIPTKPLVRFWTTAPDLQIISYGQGDAGSFRLKVDGAYVQAGILPSLGDGAVSYARLTWGDGGADQRQPRLYEIEGEAAFAFGGVRTPAIDSVWPAPVADPLRLLVHGDSFVEGAGSTRTALQQPLAPLIGTLAGQPDTIVSGLGGTGWFATVNGTRTTFGQRVQTDVIDTAPDVIVELGGLNDNGSIGGSAATMQQAVAAWLQQVVNALPDVLIFMTGPMAPHGNMAELIPVRDGKQAAAAQFPNNVVFIDNIAEAWITGTGDVSAPGNDGTASWVTSGDNTHPTDAGHLYLARRVVEAITARLPQVG